MHNGNDKMKSDIYHNIFIYNML